MLIQANALQCMESSINPHCSACLNTPRPTKCWPRHAMAGIFLLRPFCGCQHTQLRLRDFGPNRFRSQRTLHSAPTAFGFQGSAFVFQGSVREGRTDSVRPRLADRLAAKDKTLPRVLDGNSAHPRTPGALVHYCRATLRASATQSIFSLDAAFRFQLLCGNRRLPHSSRLGETCPA